jgi:hypothetical protein
VEPRAWHWIARRYHAPRWRREIQRLAEPRMR